MRSDTLLSRKLESRLAKKQDEMEKQPAVFASTVAVANQINFNYVTIGDKTIPVYNDRVPAHAGVKIWVGYDAMDLTGGKRKKFQVLGTRSEDPTSGQSASFGPAPSARYEWMAKGGGQDMLNVHQRAITFLRVGVSTLDGNVNLYSGKIWTGTAYKNIVRQDVDISAQVPTTIGKAALVMISINNTGAVVQTKGSEVDIADLNETSRPAVPADTAYVSACVRVYYGQVKPQEGRVNTDFDDLRFTWFQSGGEFDLASAIHAATSKATPVDDDEFPLADSAASYGLKKLTWANLKAALKTFFDGIYSALSHTHDWIADANTWTYSSGIRSQAFTNDPAIGGTSLSMTDTSGFVVGQRVKVTSSAGSEYCYITAIVTNISLSITPLTLDHTTTSRVVDLMQSTFVVSVNANMTNIINLGDRIKFTQTSVKYAIVHAIGSYSGGATLITLFTGDPEVDTDYSIVNAAISSVYYSSLRFPSGFSASPSKWSLKRNDAISRTQANPTQNQWYKQLEIYFSVGLWVIEYNAFLQAFDNSGDASIFSTLSTNATTESNSNLTAAVIMSAIGPTSMGGFLSANRKDTVLIGSEATYFFNLKTTVANQSSIYVRGDAIPTKITATSFYI